MIQIEFKYNKKQDWLTPIFTDEKYSSVELIGNRNWTSQRIEEDIEYTKQAKAGSLKLEEGEDDFYIGFEGSPGIIYVKNGDRAYVETQYEDREDYLILEFDELLDILEQMYNFLKSIGK